MRSSFTCSILITKWHVHLNFVFCVLQTNINTSSNNFVSIFLVSVCSRTFQSLMHFFFVHFKKVLFYLLAFFEQSTKKRIKDAKLTIIIIWLSWHNLLCRFFSFSFFFWLYFFFPCPFLVLYIKVRKVEQKNKESIVFFGF